MSDNVKEILQMIKDGVVSVDDAVRLIEAVDKKPSSAARTRSVSEGEEGTSFRDVAETFADYVKITAPKVIDGAGKIAQKTGVVIGDAVKSTEEYIRKQCQKKEAEEAEVIDIDDYLSKGNEEVDEEAEAATENIVSEEVASEVTTDDAAEETTPDTEE